MVGSALQHRVPKAASGQAWTIGSGLRMLKRSSALNSWAPAA